MMNPDQNYGNNPYDFIMQGGQPTQPQKRPSVSNDTKKRVLIVTAVVFFLVLGAIIVSSILSSAGKSEINTLYSLAAEQSELVRVSDLGLLEARDSRARNLAATTSLTMKTIQARTLKLIEFKGQKVDPKALTAKINLTSDGALNTAKVQNNYDEVFTNLLVTALTKYGNSARNAHNVVSADNGGKDVMKTAYENVNLMLVAPQPVQ